MTLSNQFRITLASNVKSICLGLQLCLGISVSVSWHERYSKRRKQLRLVTELTIFTLPITHLVNSGLVLQRNVMWTWAKVQQSSNKEQLISSNMTHSNKKANRLKLTVSQLVEQQKNVLIMGGGFICHASFIIHSSHPFNFKVNNKNLHNCSKNSEEVPVHK